MGALPIKQLLIAALSPGPALGQARAVPSPAPQLSPGDAGTQPWGAHETGSRALDTTATAPEPSGGPCGAETQPPGHPRPWAKSSRPAHIPPPSISAERPPCCPHAAATGALRHAWSPVPQGQGRRAIPMAWAEVGGPHPEAHLSRLLLELLNGPLVDAPAFVDEVASRGGLAGVHVANDHDVDVGLLLAHSSGVWGHCTTWAALARGRGC